MEKLHLSNLKTLEAESIHIIREVAAEFERPVMLYSVGKDSSVMVRLAQKAFHPGKIPFPLLHVDTGHEVPRDVRVPRQLLQRDRGRPARLPLRGSHRSGHRSLGPGHGEVLRAPQDPGAAERAEGGRLRRRVRGRAAGRGEVARQGADLLVPRRVRPVGPQEPAARALEPLQRPHQQGREHPRLPALQLDGAGRLALHPLEKTSPSCRCISPPSARWSSARAG